MTLVVIQRGHYPRTSGATGAPGEQEYAVETSNILAAQLREYGFEARVINADEPLDDYRGDMFVALHYDSASSASASGASVGWQTSEGSRFAQMWKNYYALHGWDRGFRKDNYTANLGQYYGVRNAISVGNKAAIITEAGFHTNIYDRAQINPQLTAISIVDAIKEYTGWEDDVVDYARIDSIVAKHVNVLRSEIRNEVLAVLTKGGTVPNRVVSDAPQSVIAALSRIHEDAYYMGESLKEK